MMNNTRLNEPSSISINQLCDFITASDRRKISILKKQKFPSPFMTTRYRIARSCMKNFITNNFSYSEILKGIERLQSMKCSTDFEENDRKNSIKALEQFIHIKFPDYFKDKLFTFSKTEQGYILVNDVKIIVSPDIILSWVENGSKCIGGIKFHLSQSNIFDFEKSSFSANMIRVFLEEVLCNNIGHIDENFCLCVDVFGSRVCAASQELSGCKIKLEKACIEIKDLWKTI